MRRTLKLSLVAVATLVIAITVPANALASSITATYAMTLGLISGTDTLGLDNATLALSATFDVPQTYVEEFAIPAVASTSNSLTITSASVSATNGTYAEPDGIDFFPTFSGQIWNGLGFAATYFVNGELLTLLPSGDVSNVDIGDPFRSSDFRSFDADTSWQGDGVIYSIDAVRLEITGDDVSVPEPATLALLGAGALGALAKGRRRRHP